MDDLLSLEQLATAWKILTTVCGILGIVFIFIITIWPNVPAMVTIGVLFVAVVIALIVVTVRLGQRAREATRTERNAAAVTRAEAMDEAGTPPVFVIGRPTEPAVNSQTQGYTRAQTFTQGPAADDPPPAYSELPLYVREKGARVRESATGRVNVATPHVHAARPTASKINIESASAINENVHWDAEGLTEHGQRQPKPRARGAHVSSKLDIESASAINENVHRNAEGLTETAAQRQPKSRARGVKVVSQIDIESTSAINEEPGQRKPKPRGRGLKLLSKLDIESTSAINENFNWSLEEMVEPIQIPPNPRVRATQVSSTLDIESVSAVNDVYCDVDSILEPGKTQPKPRARATRAPSRVDIESTSAVNENVRWDAEGQTEHGQRQPKPRARATRAPSRVDIESASAVNENVRWDAEGMTETAQRQETPKSRGNKFRSKLDIQSTSAANENVHWNAEGLTEPGQRQPKPRTRAAFSSKVDIQSALAPAVNENENCNPDERVETAQRQPKPRARAARASPKLEIGVASAVNENVHQPKPRARDPASISPPPANITRQRDRTSTLGLRQPARARSRPSGARRSRFGFSAMSTLQSESAID